MAFYLLNLKCRHKRTSSPIFSCSKILRMNQFKILADFVNLYLQEVLIELSKVGKLCSKAGESALDLTPTDNKPKKLSVCKHIIITTNNNNIHNNKVSQPWTYLMTTRSPMNPDVSKNDNNKNVRHHIKATICLLM